MPDINATDAASTADTPAPAKAEAPELKSTDTGVLSALRAKADTATPPSSSAKPDGEKPAVQQDSHANPADKGPDADSAAEHQDDDDRKIEPWMRKRLSRAEERGRKQASAEILDVIRSLRPSPGESAKPAVSTDTPVAESPKTLADFDYDLGKFTKYEIREGVKTALAERDAEQDKARAERAAEEARTAFDTRKAEFEKRVGEGAWDEMVSAKVDVPQEVIDLLMGHPKDLDIAHYLVNHTDELAKLRGKSKLEIARGLAAIETKLSAKATEPPPKITKAPPPADELPSGTKSSKSIDEMSTAERIAHWRQQKASNQRR